MSTKDRAGRLKFLRMRANFRTAKAGAEYLGVNVQTYRSHENGTRNFDADEAAHYARRYQGSAEWLLFGDPSQAPTDYAPLSGDVRLAPDIPSPLVSELPHDVPVMGTAAAAAIAAFRIGPMVDVVRRPPGIQGARDVYAIFVVGHSMEPAHPPGEIRFISPHRPPKPGDSVVVRMRPHETAEEEAYLGILKKLDERRVTLRKLNPDSAMSLERRYVTAIHKVLTLNELFGV